MEDLWGVLGLSPHSWPQWILVKLLLLMHFHFRINESYPATLNKGWAWIFANERPALLGLSCLQIVVSPPGLAMYFYHKVFCPIFLYLCLSLPHPSQNILHGHCQPQSPHIRSLLYQLFPMAAWNALQHRLKKIIIKKKQEWQKEETQVEECWLNDLNT